MLGTVFARDYCRDRKNNSVQNLNIIRKLVMVLLENADFSEIVKKKYLVIINKILNC